VINFSPPVPDVAPTLQTLTDMLALLSNPEKSAARVAELQANTASLQQAVADHKAERATFTLAQAEHRATLEKQAADAAASLTSAQEKFDAECAQRKELQDDREARLAELQSEAAADAKAAKVARADFERRLSIIKSATG
jgi:hypothetical protein